MLLPVDFIKPKPVKHMIRNVSKYIVGFILLLLLFHLCWTGPVYAGERIYYSIHLNSFKKLEDANSTINALLDKGKLVFWRKTNVPGEGVFYKIYLGKYENRQDAVEYWQKLNRSGAVSHFAIQLFTETTEPAKRKTTARQPPTGPAIAIKNIPPEERFVDNQDGTVTDRATGLMWLQNGWKFDFVTAVPWFDAMEKLKNFRHGNYTDWRLPTNAEWQSLIDPRNRNPALVEPNPFVNIISHMPYWSQSEYNYGQRHICDQLCTIDSYIVMLYSGQFSHQDKRELAFILPVRSVQ